MVLEKPRLQVDEYERFIALPENRDRRLELIDGMIVEKPMPTQAHGRLSATLAGELYFYLRQNPIGYVEVEVRYRPAADAANDRLPDVSFVADAQTPAVTRGAVLRMPDLAVEIKSPDDSILDLRSKIAYYLANGARLCWLLIPEKRLIEVYPQGQDVILLTENDTLDGLDVLPGFSVAVARLFQGLS